MILSKPIFPTPSLQGSTGMSYLLSHTSSPTLKRPLAVGGKHGMHITPFKSTASPEGTVIIPNLQMKNWGRDWLPLEGHPRTRSVYLQTLNYYVNHMCMYPSHTKKVFKCLNSAIICKVSNINPHPKVTGHKQQADVAISLNLMEMWFLLYLSYK